MDLTTVTRRGRRVMGAALVALASLPVHRLLSDPVTGPAGASTVRLADATWSLVWWGTLLVAVISLLLARGLPGIDPERAADPVNRLIAGLSDRALAAGAAMLAAVTCAALGRWLFQGYPTLLDEMAQLLQGRYFAAGLDAGPAPDPAAAWLIQNTLVTEGGWTSQYPPFHTLILSLGLDLGRPWLVGPVMSAITVFFTVRIAARLLPDRREVVAWGSLLLALSPFILVLGAGYLSHVSAAALVAAGLWWSLRTVDGRAAWAVPVGLCGGLLLATRPWTGLILSGFFTVGLWLPSAPTRGGARWLAARLLLAGAGSLPAVLWLAGYNARMFGSPLTFGYSVAQGPAHGLGFHADPWGNHYGPLQALGYSGADLLQLGVHLLETPVSLVLVVGVYLLVARRLAHGTRMLLAWALLPVAANILYWHHGYHLGPRMLYEAAPAWILLGTLSVFELMEALPHGWPRRAICWGVALSAAAAVTLGVPGRLPTYRWSPDTLARITVPPQTAASLVFVHGPWTGRLSARLAGLGMRLDSVETALRRNDTCAVQSFVAAWAHLGDRERAQAERPLDFEPLPGDAPSLERVAVGEGSVIRSDRTRAPTPGCRQEARADRMGVVELAPLLWQGDLPGIERGRPVFVRDLGPAENQAVRDGYPGRLAYLLTPSGPGRPPELLPYDEGVGLLWERPPEPGDRRSGGSPQ